MTKILEPRPINDKQLVDTNILVYGIDENSKYYERSRRVINNPDKQLLTTSKNIAELLTVVTRQPPKGYGIEIKVAMEILNAIENSMDILFSTNYSFSIFKDLIKKYQTKGLKLRDIEIVSIMLANNINKIATINQKDFEYLEDVEIIKV